MSTVIGAQTITKNPSYGPSFHFERMGYLEMITPDGSRIVYDQGVDIVRGIIRLRNVSKTEATALRTYIKDTLVYGTNAITLNPPTNTDFGKGDNTNITSAYWDGGPSTDRYFEYVPPGKYNIDFPYWAKL